MNFLKPGKNRFQGRLTLSSILTHCKNTVLLLFLFTLATSIQGQDIIYKKPAYPSLNIGFGAGMDYGGFGARATVVTIERIEIFGAIGYNLLGAGVNFGMDCRLAPKSRICPYIGAMYGYNAVIIVDGTDEYDKTYYGPSFNLGLEFWSRRRPRFFNLELIVPVRSEEYHDSMKDLKNNQGVVFETEPLPIAFSIGYHFVL